MKCDKCGADIPIYNTFCPSCGADAPGHETFHPIPGAQNNYGFDRPKLKADAKEALRGRYWYAFLVCLISIVIINLLSYPQSIANFIYRISAFTDFVPGPVVLGLLSFSTSASLLSLLYNIFIGNMMAVGSAKYFINNRKRQGEISELFYAFRE